MYKKLLVFILSTLLLFVGCEGEYSENKGVENVKGKTKTNEKAEKVISSPSKKATNDNVIDGVLIEVRGAERINSNLVGIDLFLENKTSHEKYVSGNFTAMDTETKKVLDQEYPYENGLDKVDIINLNDLPEGSNWEGKIFFDTSSNHITLIYNDFSNNKKKYNIEITQ